MYETTLNLSPPAFLTLKLPGGDPAARIDVYDARRKLEDANRQPSDELKWAAVLDYLAGKLKVPRESLAESTAIEFNDAVVQIVMRLNDERKKKLDSTLNSQPPTRESPATTEHGQ